MFGFVLSSSTCGYATLTRKIFLIICVLLLHSITSLSVEEVRNNHQRTKVFPEVARLGVDIPLVDCSEPNCDGPLAPIYCSGPIVAASWHLGVYHWCFDQFRKLLFTPEQIVANFTKLIANENKEIRRADLENFCRIHFSEKISHLQQANLSDWRPNPPKAFNDINNSEMRKFADELHKIWPELARTFSEEVLAEPERFKVSPVKNPFIVPGGFFEYYFYWDSYWVLKGLYFSGMRDTARGMLDNFAGIIRRKGYIPNSANLEHSRRSQQPYFVPMIADYFEQTGDRRFLEEFLPVAELEFDWWMRNRSVAVSTADGSQHFTMFQFRAISNCPRAEGFGEDFPLGMSLGSLEKAQFFWSSSHAVCESGWDFSSRWYSDYGPNDTLHKGLSEMLNIVPVDLNALIAMNYQTVADLYENILQNKAKAAEYSEKASALRQAIQTLMHDANGTGVWFDWDLMKKTPRKRGFYTSNVYPLMLLDRFYPGPGGAEARAVQCARTLSYLRDEGVLDFPGGVPSSMERRSGQQWDFPNQWAPITHLFVVSLMNCQRVMPAAERVAKRVADGYLRTSLRGLINPPRTQPGQMWEKYDARFDDGTVGFGGEYPAQNGFGWSNGAALDLIRMFYTDRLKGRGMRGLMRAVESPLESNAKMR